MDSNIFSAIDSTVGQSVTSKTTTTKTLGKDDFMKLLLAQLKNQDPLKPLDGTDFAAQLAQFSSLEQLSNMNAELKNQSVNQMTMNYAQSVNMIGKDVVTNSGNSLVVSGPTTDLNYKLSADAETVTITILDKKGNLVKTWDETAQKAGMNKVTWDTSDVEKEDYTFQVIAKDSKGQTVSVDTTDQRAGDCSPLPEQSDPGDGGLEGNNHPEAGDRHCYGPFFDGTACRIG